MIDALLYIAGGLLLVSLVGYVCYKSGMQNAFRDMQDKIISENLKLAEQALDFAKKQTSFPANKDVAIDLWKLIELVSNNEIGIEEAYARSQKYFTRNQKTLYITKVKENV